MQKITEHCYIDGNMFNSTEYHSKNFQVEISPNQDGNVVIQVWSQPIIENFEIPRKSQNYSNITILNRNMLPVVANHVTIMTDPWRVDM